MSQTTVFVPTLVNEQNAEEIAEQLRAVFYGKLVDAKVTGWRGETDHIQGELFDNGIRVASNQERNHQTNSTHLGWVFTRFAFAFESNDDVIIEWLGSNSVRFTNQREPRVEKPIREVIFTVMQP